MYVPQTFTENDPTALLDVIDQYGFGTLLTSTPSGPLVSHLPLFVDRSEPDRPKLLGHVARANRHWETFDGEQAALAIFHGPHAYISPAWYPTSPAVPTWNYAVVHVHGKPRQLPEDSTLDILRRLIEQYEAERTNRWQGNLPQDFLDRELRAIVGFEIPVDRLEGKFKLSQNRSDADREGALAGLEREGGANRDLAQFARRYFARRDAGR